MRPLARLAWDVAANAVLGAVERVHAACEVVLFDEAERAANRLHRERVRVQTRADRYTRRAIERRQCS